VVGQKSGPRRCVRNGRDRGKNAQGFTITWPIDNFINTRFKVTKPENTIVFAQRRPVRSRVKDSGYEMGVYTSYAPENDTKTCGPPG